MYNNSTRETMETRPITHAEAVYLARAMNLEIQTVWEITRNVPFSSYSDLESTIRRQVAGGVNTEMENDFRVPSF
jgi:hypothetical protein